MSALYCAVHNMHNALRNWGDNPCRRRADWEPVPSRCRGAGLGRCRTLAAIKRGAIHDERSQLGLGGGCCVGTGDERGATVAVRLTRRHGDDETGAAIPGATVSVTQAETNLSRSIVTNETGSYNVPNLLPGTYEIVVSLTGISDLATRDVAVRQGLDLRVDVRLTVGALEESVVVSGSGRRAADRKCRGAVAHDEGASSRRCRPAAAPTRRHSR